jgi:hypothetical protein
MQYDSSCQPLSGSDTGQRLAVVIWQLHAQVAGGGNPVGCGRGCRPMWLTNVTYYTYCSARLGVEEHATVGAC